MTKTKRNEQNALGPTTWRTQLGKEPSQTRYQLKCLTFEDLELRTRGYSGGSAVVSALQTNPWNPYKGGRREPT